MKLSITLTSNYNLIKHLIIKYVYMAPVDNNLKHSTRATDKIVQFACIQLKRLLANFGLIPQELSVA